MCSYKYFADKSLIVSRCSSSFPCVACAIPNLSTVRVDHNTSRSRIDWKWLKWNSISTRKHIRGYECWMHYCTVYNLYNNLYNMYITLDASRISIWQIQSGFFPRLPGHSSKVASSFDKSPPSWKQTSDVCNWHQLLVNLIILWIRITSISMNHLAKLPLWKILYFSFIQCIPKERHILTKIPMTHSLAPTTLTASANGSPELTSVPDLQENVIHAGCCSSLAEEIETFPPEVQNAWRE